ncbi:MAG: NAD(P)-dependent oxidoreductase [Firmicutes bacterium]|nr:NAD(P)-dependent oxidoreductase [Bacillota bacterium]
MKIGFIGFGEAAYFISVGLNQQGVTGMVAYDTMAQHPTMGMLVQKRAQESSVALLESASAVARMVDVLFIAVPSSYALDVCREVVGDLHQGQIYADVSASTPATKLEIWKLLEPTGVLFVDAAMLGSLPQYKHRVPIAASGNGAEAFCDVMSPLGMCITLTGEQPGAASAIKLVRSIFMKGLGALMCEMLQAADAYGVANEVIASIGKSLDGIPFTKHLDRLVIGTAIHASRRAAELKGSIKMLKECALDSTMSVASMHKHEMMSEFRFAELYAMQKPESWQQIIIDMKQDKGRRRCRSVKGYI